jgi:hypothetical protein
MGGAPRGAVLGRGADRRDERLRVAITLLLTTKSPHMLPVGEWVVGFEVREVVHANTT